MVEREYFKTQYWSGNADGTGVWVNTGETFTEIEESREAINKAMRYLVDKFGPDVNARYRILKITEEEVV